MCKCPPQDTKCTPRQSKSQFLGQYLLGGLDLEVYLYIWTATTKKGRAPPRQNPGYAYGVKIGNCPSTCPILLWTHWVTWRTPLPQEDSSMNTSGEELKYQLWIVSSTVCNHVLARHKIHPCIGSIYQVNQKNPPYDFCWYYSNAWEFLYEILHDC